MEYFSYLSAKAHKEQILAVHEKRQKWVNQEKKGFLRYRIPYHELSRYQTNHIDCSGDTVIIGKKDELNDQERTQLKKHLQAFMPWRKGPFSVFGIDIDGEWRSEKKWHRVIPVLPEIKDKVIADIGCNNGYYMFRMSSNKPRLVLGFEPSVQHYYCFKGLNSMANQQNLFIDLLGIEHLQLFADCFDLVFLMGIIYHRPSPVDTLKDILIGLKPGGTLILETQAIPGEEPYALFPETTYAKVPGTYFVPTGSCLYNWLNKAGFTEIELFSSHPMSSKYQRRTEWMVFESYQDFINKNNPKLTVEGYPAPHRIFIKACKKQ